MAVVGRGLDVLYHNILILNTSAPLPILGSYEAREGICIILLSLVAFIMKFLCEKILIIKKTFSTNVVGGKHNALTSSILHVFEREK